MLTNDIVMTPASPIPSPFPPLSLTHTPLSGAGSDQAAGAGGVHYEKRERSHSIYISHTPSGKLHGVVLPYLSHP